MITVAELREYVQYDDATGAIHYKCSKKLAASKTSKGYIRLKVNGNEILAHRAAWALAFGAWPATFIDHINEDKQDNRLCNLREVTQSQNLQNQSKPMRRSSTGVRGVSKSRKKFKVHVCKDGINSYVGTFETLAAAQQAYLQAKNSTTSSN